MNLDEVFNLNNPDLNMNLNLNPDEEIRAKERKRKERRTEIKQKLRASRDVIHESPLI